MRAPVNSQRDVLLDLLDAVSDSAPVVVAVRGSDGGVAQHHAAHSGSGRAPSADRALGAHERPGGQLLRAARFPPVLGSVEPDGPAAHSGLKAGDTILGVDGAAVRDFQEVVELPFRRVRVRPSRSATGAAAIEATAQVPVLAEVHDGKTIGRIHVRPPPLPPYPESMLRHIHLSLPAAFVRANVEAWDMTALQARLFWRMLIGQVSMKNLSGPLSIAEYAGDSAALGAGLVSVFPGRRQPGAGLHEPAADPDSRRRPDRVSDH